MKAKYLEYTDTKTGEMGLGYFIQIKADSREEADQICEKLSSSKGTDWNTFILTILIFASFFVLTVINVESPIPV